MTGRRWWQVLALTAAGVAVAVPGGAPAVAAPPIPASSPVHAHRFTPLVRVAAAALGELPRSARLGGRPAPGRRLGLTVALRPRDPRGLHTLATAVSTPGNRRRGDFLSVPQFARRFGATPATITRVRRALTRDGFRLGGVSANHLSLKASGTVAEIGRRFHTSITNVRLPGGGRAHTNATAATLPAGLAANVQGVIGLDSADLAQSELAPGAGRESARVGAQAPASPLTATGGPQPCPAASAAVVGNHGGYTADQLARTYGFSRLYAAGDFGGGETIAVYEMGQPYLTADLAAYKACYRLRGRPIAPRITLVPVDGGPGPYVRDAPSTPSGDDGEVTLDLDVLMGLVPRARILVYSAPPVGTAQEDLLSAIVSQDRAQVVSISYAQCEELTTPSVIAAENTLLEEAAVQGQTVVSASGDYGSEGCAQIESGDTTLAVDDPASQPFDTAVGGTHLDADATETVWNGGPGATTGGGLSTRWAMPPYQRAAPSRLGVLGTDSTVPGVSCAARRCREVPDVSADADARSGYVVHTNGNWGVTGGTSGGAPLWAALTAEAEALPACRGAALGFENPSLYRLAAAGRADFTDVRLPDPLSGLSNNDELGAADGLFPVTAGYDMTTGLGTPHAAALATGLCRLRGSRPSTPHAIR